MAPGDDSKISLNDEEWIALGKLKKMLDRKTEDDENSDDGFSAKDKVVIRKMIHLYQSFAAIGFFGSMLRNVVVWFGIVAGGYIVLNKNVIEFIRNAVSGGGN